MAPALRIFLVCYCSHAFTATGKKLKKGKTPDVIADELETDISKIQAICKAAKRFAPDYDTKMIFNALEAGG